MGNPLPSRHRVSRWVVPVLLGTMFVPGVAAGPDDPVFRAQVAPVLKRYCLGCHAGKKPKGGLHLDSLAPDFEKNSSRWKEVLDRLADHSMPPRGKPQPTVREARVV